MPNPIRWLFNAAKQAYQRFRGDKLEATVKVDTSLRDDFQDKSRGWAADLTDDLYTLLITIQQWQSQFREGLKNQYIAQYVTARGGRENMTQEDWGRLGGLLKNQYTYHNRFAQDIIDGKMSLGQARFRAGMYQQSSGQAFERAKAISLGVPYDQIPAWPRDGQTVCLTQCMCSWRFVRTESGWDCFWELGEADHCVDCLENADKWNPLMVTE